MSIENLPKAKRRSLWHRYWDNYQEYRRWRFDRICALRAAWLNTTRYSRYAK